MDPLADFLVPNVSAGSGTSDFEKRESQASHADGRSGRSRANSSRNIEILSPSTSGVLLPGSAEDSLSGSANLAMSSDASRFGREVAETVHRMLLEKHTIDNLALEVNALKFAYNKTFLDCARAVIHALLAPKPEVRALPSKKLLELINEDIKRCAPLLRKYLNEHDDQIDAVYTVQEVCEDDASIAKIFAGLLHTLYDVDVVSESAVQAWAKESKSSDDQSFLKRAAPFLEWLAEAEEDDENDDDDD
jgi:translation initiation factor eIF-2B subunit epsilon